MKRVLIATTLAFGVPASPAAADQVIQGLDVLPAPVWDKPNISVAPGEKVTWTFAGTTQAHHVASDGSDVANADWAALNSPIGVAPPDVTFTFASEGTYKYVCTVHRTSMTGTVTVGKPAVEVVVPLSQQPLTNDVTAGPVTFEKVDEDKAKPRLSAVSAKRVAKGSVRVRFRVNEESTVLVSLKRGGKTVKKAQLAGKGTGGVTLKGAKAGRYRVQVRATDVAGNVSSLKKTSITVR